VANPTHRTSHSRVQLRGACRKRDKGRQSGRLDPAAIAQFLGFRDWLISKVRVSSPDRARDAIYLVAATVDAPAGMVEHAVFGEDLVDGGAATGGIVFTEDVVKITGQQGRYAIGHGLSPLGIECGLRYLLSPPTDTLKRRSLTYGRSLGYSAPCAFHGPTPAKWVGVIRVM